MNCFLIAYMIIVSVIIIYILHSTKIIQQIYGLKSIKKIDTNNIKMVKICLFFSLITIPFIFIYYQKYIIGSILFIVNIYLALFIVRTMNDTENILKEEISEYIQALIKEFSIQDNLLIAFENSIFENEGVFIKPIFSPILDEVLKSQNTDIFGKHAETCENLWIASILMILDEHTKSADRDATIKSLDDLYELININISITQENKSKSNIMMINNKILMFVGILGGICNFIFNYYCKTFFILTFKGNVIFILSDLLLFMTLIIFAKMIKGFSS